MFKSALYINNFVILVCFLGSNILTDVSIMVAQKMPLKILQAVTKVFNIPIVTTEMPLCHPTPLNYVSNCLNEFSLTVGHKQLSSGALELLKEAQLNQIAVIFQSK